MPVEQNGSIVEIPIDHQYVLNFSHKIIGRSNIAFPIVDTFVSQHEDNTHNQVTFIYAKSINASPEERKGDVFLVGNFDSLYIKRKLHPIFFENSPTRFFAVSLKLPSKSLYHYKFFINGEFVIDSLNELTEKLDNGVIWSSFFTEYYKTPVVFEEWESVILRRLIAYMLPFKTDEFITFAQQYQNQLSGTTKSLLSKINYDIGCANFIDKLIAREERHHIISYKICLKEIKRVLLSLNSFQEPGEMDEYFYQQVHQIMNENNFILWNKNVYENPSYFIKILRRHIITAAFSHPKHGGNTDALGWQFLNATLQGGDHTAAGFDWKQALEKPLGTNEKYLG